MSDSDAAEPAAASERGREVWIEKYRPQALDDVMGQEAIVERLQSYISKQDLPHLLFSGPAGVGKCVTGETPVLTNRGLERIGETVGDVDGFEEVGGNLEVLTFDDHGEFHYTEPSHLFGKTTADLVRVSTRDGNELTTTPEHRHLVLGAEGFDWKRAQEIESGDRIVRPLEAPLPDADPTLDWLREMDGDRTLVHVTESFAREHEIPVEEDFVGGKKAVVRGLRKGASPAEITDRTDLPRKTVLEYRRAVADRDLEAPSTVASLGYLRSLDAGNEEIKRHVTAIQYVNENNQRSPAITPPEKVTPELARFVGLAVSEARIDGGRIKFYNEDEDLLAAFSAAARACFGLDPDEGVQKGVPYRRLGSRTLVDYLGACFDVFDGAMGGGGIGSTLLRADEESRAAFLRAMFDAEGHVTEHGIIELSQRNGDLITLLSYLLATVGVPSRRDTDRKAPTNGPGGERTYHTLYVSGAGALSRFENAVGFGIDRKAERLAQNAARKSNPNHDTIRVQSAVSDLCDRLHLSKSSLTTASLDPERPGRERYLEDAERVLDAATEKVEVAQEVLSELNRLEPDLRAVDRVPAAWAGRRESLAPMDARRPISETTGVRTDRLLEYSDGRRTPTADRAGSILSELDVLEREPPVESVQRTLSGGVERLGVPYSRLAQGLDLRNTDVINLLEHDGHDLSSLSRFRSVADRLREVATEMCSEAVLSDLRALDTLTRAPVYLDEVEAAERVEEERRVYDLTVPGTRNYVAGAVPSVMHNTTCATAIAKEVYGEEWRENFLELNASDERGIDVVRDRIKSFARASFGGYDYRIIFLDEADALTSDAQGALRRTMEQFSNNTRFILSCNYSSQIIDPIQSRCAVFRFSPLGDDAVEREIRAIAENEGIELADSGLDALVYAADGDMRKAINGLQAAAVMGETVDEDAVYAITSTARPEEIEAMVTKALAGDFTAARSQLDDLLTESGIAGGDIIDQLHRSVWEFDLSDEAAVQLMERVGETDYRITAGANEQIQLEALLASLATDD